MLDTDTVSHLVRAHQNVSKHLVATPMASLCVSSVTEGELRFGMEKQPAARKLRMVVDEFLRRVDVLPWASAVARRYGLLRAQSERAGKPLAPLDFLIAVHALDAVLVTNDAAFRQIDGLQVVDWTLP